MSQTSILKILNEFDKKEKEQVYDFILYIAEKRNKKIGKRQNNIKLSKKEDLYNRFDNVVTSMRQTVKNSGKQGMKLTEINKIIEKARKDSK